MLQIASFCKKDLKFSSDYDIINVLYFVVSKDNNEFNTAPIVDWKKADSLMFSAIIRFSNLPNGPSEPSFISKSTLPFSYPLVLNEVFKVFLTPKNFNKVSIIGFSWDALFIFNNKEQKNWRW